MPTGNTTTDALADSLNVVLAGARIVNEYEGVMAQLVDRQTLGEGDGRAWREVAFEKLTAQAITENTVLDNPQQAVDTLTSITLTMTGIQTLLTDEMARRISKKAYGKLGALAQNAMSRKEDADGLVVLDGAVTSLSGAGTTLVSGVIAAASVRATSNSTEPAPLPIRCVLHGFQIKDIWDELTGAIGTYEIGTDAGLTARVFKEGFKGMISNAQIYEDGNIVIDGNDDAKGGVFARDAIILVRGASLRPEMRREPHIGGGSTSLFLYADYAYGERSAGNWLYEVFSDATAPTS